MPEYFSGFLSISLVHSEVAKGGLVPGSGVSSVHVLVSPPLHSRGLRGLRSSSSAAGGGQSFSYNGWKMIRYHSEYPAWRDQVAKVYVKVNNFGNQNRVSQGLYWIE